MPLPLLRAVHSGGVLPLPDPYVGLRNSAYAVRFFPGQLVMWAGPPGGGKTMLALHAVLKMGVSCLYFSADSDERTISSRAASALTGHPLSSVCGAWEHGFFREQYGSVLRQAKVRFEFEPTDPSIVDITHALEAYVEVEGVYPQILVVDTLTNTEAGEGNGNEWGGYKKTLKDLHWVGRRTGVCVWVLCHTSEQNLEYILGPPPRSAIQGKVSQFPELIITLAVDGEGYMLLGIVKHRHGVQDPAAKHPVKFLVDLSRVRIDDIRMDGGQFGA
jgi:AAA domain